MSLPHEYRPGANDDVADAYHWYEGQQAGRGDEFLMELDALVGEICARPESHGRIRGQVRAAPMSYSRYIVYFRIDPTQITILAVQHERADPKRWLKRK